MTRLRHESEPRFWSKITKPLKQFQSFLSTHRRGGRATMAFNVPALVGSFAAQTVVVFASRAAPKFMLAVPSTRVCVCSMAICAQVQRQALRRPEQRRGRRGVHDGVEINQCAGCTRQFFNKSFHGDDAAVPAPSSGEEPASPRHRAGVASMAWRSTRRFSANAP